MADHSTIEPPAALATPTDLAPGAVRDVTGALNAALADVLALYLKTKSFHWHVSGPHFRELHGLFDAQAAQLLGITDTLAERARKLGASTVKSIGHVSRLQRVLDNDAGFVEPFAMVAELREDNLDLVRRLRITHELCTEAGDVASAGIIETCIDEAEGRVWFLYEVGRR